MTVKCASSVLSSVLSLFQALSDAKDLTFYDDEYGTHGSHGPLDPLGKYGEQRDIQSARDLAENLFNAARDMGNATTECSIGKPGQVITQRIKALSDSAYDIGKKFHSGEYRISEHRNYSSGPVPVDEVDLITNIEGEIRKLLDDLRKHDFRFGVVPTVDVNPLRRELTP